MDVPVCVRVAVTVPVNDTLPADRVTREARVRWPLYQPGIPGGDFDHLFNRTYAHVRPNLKRDAAERVSEAMWGDS